MSGKNNCEEQTTEMHWWKGPCECSICGHEWRAAIEIPCEHEEPIVPLECPDCGNMTGQPILA